MATKIRLAQIINNAKARAYALTSAPQNNITAGTWTKIVLGGETFDPGNNFASSSYTCPVTGYYLVSGAINFAGGTAGGRVLAAIYQNDADGLAFATSDLAGDGIGGAYVTTVLYFTSGTTVQLYGLVVTGSVTDIVLGSPETYLSIHLLST